MPRNSFKPVHGHARRSGSSPTYSTWESMIGRCQRPTAGSYALYGGRGIKVCPRWQSFENFLADMGEKPPGTSIDRIDANGNYEPENCRWASHRAQCNNRRYCRQIEFRGRTQTLQQWCDELGLVYNTTYYRLRHGWSIEDALTKPRGYVPARSRA